MRDSLHVSCIAFQAAHAVTCSLLLNVQKVYQATSDSVHTRQHSKLQVTIMMPK
jgi:hypothetical protein